MRQLLIFTTTRDISLPLFSQIRSQEIKVTVCWYREDVNTIQKLLKTQCDLIYLRDPFTETSPSLSHSEIRTKIQYILDNKPKRAYLIDKIRNAEDVFFEDKWEQYKYLGKYMPQTGLLSEIEAQLTSSVIIKKRISSRGKGIFFKKPIEVTHPNEYIVQRRLDPVEEYRIFCLRKTVVSPIAIRSSKTESGKAKMIGLTDLKESLYAFVKPIMNTVRYDLYGLDVIQAADGKYYLLELNRSPQFSGYMRLTGINMAERLIAML